ncbi:extensin family protein [Pelagibacterium sp.]|uniref:extensin-like domain-containing protein n=1 Tax=Pelagibacterium sp. TaxID=1967288 RepID=UPI003A8D0253
MTRITLLIIFALTALVPANGQDGEPPLPQPRPQGLGAAPQPEPTNAEEGSGQEDADTDSQKGELDRVYQTACPALLSGLVVGEILPPLSEGTCGLQSPIAVSAILVNGRSIPLTGSPVTNCAAVTALADWAREVDAYAGAVLDTEIESLATGPGYQCRLRNGADSGFVSEHGLGNALDISAINLADGATISVLEDWRALPAQPESKLLTFAHSAACGRFTTVLGPEANSDHADHFHFDLGCHGRTCTAQICE